MERERHGILLYNILLLPTQVNYLRPYREKVKFRNEAHVSQGCAMSPWLFNANMEGVEREVNARVLGKGVEP